MALAGAVPLTRGERGGEHVCGVQWHRHPGGTGVGLWSMCEKCSAACRCCVMGVCVVVGRGGWLETQYSVGFDHKTGVAENLCVEVRTVELSIDLKDFNESVSW